MPKKKVTESIHMKSVNLHSKFSRFVLGSLVFLLFFTSNLSAQEGNYDNGKKLFNAQCAACHKLDKKLVGPPLKGVTEKRENEWLVAWIKDNQALIKSGDKLAKQVFEENNKLPMTPFPQLSDQDITDILEYTKGEPQPEAAVAEVDPGVALGKKLFTTNCAACHKLDKKLVGPALGGIGEKREMDWLKAWIKDNAALRASGDKLAIQVFEENNKIPMTAYPQLSDEDIENIIKYTTVGDAKPKVAAATVDNTTPTEKTGVSILTSLLLTLLAFVLLAVIVSATTKKKTAVEGDDDDNVLKSLLLSPFLRFLLLVFVLLGGAYLLFGWLFQVGVDQGYQPIQPIAFSHKVHAGDNKIDCQYCHSSAKHSKTSGIPSANVCMNCHKSISEYNGALFGGHDKAFFDGEIQKIYDAVGWDSENVKYKEGYEEKPIEWVRIHNLADFAYYNHSQHVTVAGLDCQKCHGPVETMDEVYQFSPLTMGWCIECHRDTEVDMTENGYYKNIHDQLAKKYGVEKVTVAQMGGMECGKCHY